MELVDSKTLQRRLNKSIKLAEKLRQKNLYESEANKELAKRNHFLRKSVLVEQKKGDKIKALVSALELLVNNGDGSSTSLDADLISLVNDLKDAVNETEPIVLSSEDPQTKSNRISTRRQSSMFVHLPELSGTSLVRKSAEYLKSTDEALLEEDTVAQNKFPDFNICTPLFEHFLVIGASQEAAIEFANLIQSAEDDSLSNRFMRTLGGFLSHPRFMMGSGSSGLKTPTVGTTSGTTSVMSSTPVKPHSIKEESVLELDLERRESSMSMSAVDLRHSESETISSTSTPVVPPASKSIFSYFSRPTIPSSNSTIVHTPQHQSSVVGDLLKAVADGEKDEKASTGDDAESTVISVESSSDLRLELEPETTEAEFKSPSKDDATGEHSPVANSSLDESPSKSSTNLISSTTSAMNRFGGLLNRLSVASDKTANAVVNSALKGGKSIPNLNRNRSSSAAEIPISEENSSMPVVSKPILPSTSDSALNEISDNVTVSTSDHSNIGSPSSDNISHPIIPPPIKTASLLTHSDKKVGTATTEGSILYRYPPTVEPPPPEISDFCLPLGGKLRRLFHKDEDTMVQEILFGHSHSKRSGRCFIFLLEDKTTLGDNINDDEAGIGTGRLYGICVIHPRLVRTNVVVNNHKQNAPSSVPRTDESNGEEKDFYEFESSVCYAFITRFPLFDFFFQLIFDLITLERLVRMEMAVDQSDADMKYSRNVYQYLPQSILDNCLERLTRLSPPRYNERIFFSMSKSIQSVEFFRATPRDDFPEHYVNAADWALPTLLSWMPLETIIWSLSLLMSEAKLIVVGYESGMVSCAVMGLLVLLRPLEWVAPLIPMLPLKLIDFIESPVPILAGLSLDSTEKALEINKLLDRCSDPTDGTVLAVLDVSKRELFVSNSQRKLLRNLAMPNSDALADSLRNCMRKDFDEARGRGRPLYAVSSTQRTVSRHAHDVFTSHIQGVIALANEYVPKESSIHSQNQLLVVADGFSDSDEASEDEDDGTTQNSLLEYYANIISEGDVIENVGIGANALKHEAVNSMLNSKVSNQTRYKRSTSISSHGSASATSNSVTAIMVNHEPIKLTGESLKDTDHNGFLKRFRDTQMYAEHVRNSTSSAVDAGNKDTSENIELVTDVTNNRLSLTGSSGGSRRQSMNLMFTQDHKLRLLNDNDATATNVQND